MCMTISERDHWIRKDLLAFIQKNTNLLCLFQETKHILAFWKEFNWNILIEIIYLLSWLYWHLIVAKKSNIKIITLVDSFFFFYLKTGRKKKYWSVELFNEKKYRDRSVFFHSLIIPCRPGKRFVYKEIKEETCPSISNDGSFADS